MLNLFFDGNFSCFPLENIIFLNISRRSIYETQSFTYSIWINLIHHLRSFELSRDWVEGENFSFFSIFHQFLVDHETILIFPGNFSSIFNSMFVENKSISVIETTQSMITTQLWIFLFSKSSLNDTISNSPHWTAAVNCLWSKHVQSRFLRIKTSYG